MHLVGARVKEIALMREHAISLSSGTVEDNMLSVRRAELPFAVASKAPERRRPRSWAPQQKTEKNFLDFKDERKKRLDGFSKKG